MSDSEYREKAFVAASTALRDIYYHAESAQDREILSWTLESNEHTAFLAILFRAPSLDPLAAVEYRKVVWTSTAEMDPETSGLIFSANFYEKFYRMKVLPPDDAGKRSIQ